MLDRRRRAARRSAPALPALLILVVLALAPLTVLTLSVVDAAAQTTPPVAPEPAAPRPRVVVFGDSMLAESSEVVRQAFRAQKPGWDVEIRAFPGTGICTWLDDMRAADAQAVALLFTGVYMTDCILGKRRWPDAYLSDARQVAQIFQERGTPVLWLGWPRPAGDIVSPRLDDTIWHYYEQVAAEFGHQVADPGLAVFDGAAGTYPLTMPCLHEVEPGCVDGRVPVRDLRGGHLCPVTDLVGPCPVYASGVRRYGIAIAAAIARALPRVSVWARRRG